MNRRLYRCRHDRLIAGVASGVAEYFDVDPTIVRVLWIISIFFGGLGLFAYIVMAIIMPSEPEVIVRRRSLDRRSDGRGSGPLPDRLAHDAGDPPPHRVATTVAS